LKNHFVNELHEYRLDTCILFSGIYKKLQAASKKKLCEIVGQWSHSISNHLYWCAASSDGNGELMLQKWLSILNHVVDEHEGHGDLYPRCLHGPVNDRQWMTRGTSKSLPLYVYLMITFLYLFCMSFKTKLIDKILSTYLNILTKCHENESLLIFHSSYSSNTSNTWIFFKQKYFLCTSFICDS
jgi:hypothetical protein